PVIVEAPAAPPPAAAPAPKAAPAAAVAAHAEPPKHGHGLAIGLGTTGAVLLGFMAVSIGIVVSYNNQYGGGAQTGAAFSQSRYRTAGFFNDAEWVAGALGVAGVTAAVFTW
ncbi:MAG TPA: hypothetical protein VMB50_12120, partial [Myxococcales bacterium]|nr:hypothetical protein [Myxococcales bacterium]